MMGGFIHLYAKRRHIFTNGRSVPDATNQRSQPMSRIADFRTTQPKSVEPLSTITARVDHNENIAAAEDKMVEALARHEAQLFWDIRLAAVLNVLDIAKDHGGHRDWTNKHAEQIREMMAIGEAVVGGDSSAVVPSGFGEPVRVQSAAVTRLIEDRAARMRALAALDTDAPSSEAVSEEGTK
jgi:hypothetical protein